MASGESGCFLSCVDRAGSIQATWRAGPSCGAKSREPQGQGEERGAWQGQVPWNRWSLLGCGLELALGGGLRQELRPPATCMGSGRSGSPDGAPVGGGHVPKAEPSGPHVLLPDRQTGPGPSTAESTPRADSSPASNANQPHFPEARPGQDRAYWGVWEGGRRAKPRLPRACNWLLLGCPRCWGELEPEMGQTAHRQLGRPLRPDVKPRLDPVLGGQDGELGEGACVSWES